MAVIHLDDLSLAYQEIGDGPETLLALHPSTVDGNMFQWALPKNNRFRVLLPDQRGHGDTPNPAPDFHLMRFIDDMLNFIEVMDLGAIHGVGYSLGAAVLLGIAEEQPARFQSLILFGTSYRRPNDIQLTQLAGPPEQRQGLVAQIMDPQNGIGVGRDFDLNALSKVNCPVHLISGDRDPVAPLEDTISLFRALPQGRLLIVPQCTHFGFHNHPLVMQHLQQLYEDI
jgi:3-oxoadipate enol-lactonase